MVKLKVLLVRRSYTLEYGTWNGILATGVLLTWPGGFFAKLFLRVWYMSSSWINEHIDGTNSTSYMCECEFVLYLDILHQAMVSFAYLSAFSPT